VHSCADAAHLAAIANILGGLSYSLTLHGDLPVYGFDHSSKMRRATLVSCDARPHAEQVLISVGIPGQRVKVITMGIDIHRHNDSTARNFVSSILHIATVARLNPAKGHKFALDAISIAIKEGYDIRYSIAGDGEMRSIILADVARLGLGDRVTLLGNLGEEDVQTLLSHVDAFILPSVGSGEAAPVSVMEAMASGLPVICSFIGGTPDMINDGVDGLLVPKGDVASLTSSIIRLASDTSLRQRLGAAARARAMKQFDSRAQASKLLEAIRQSLS